VVLIVMALWEALSPRKTRTVSRKIRWTNNLLLIVFNTLMVRFLVPLTAVGVATYVQMHNWGLLNLTQISAVLSSGFIILLAVFILDLAIYAQHVMFHKVPFFWRFHRMHHADLDIDVTTGIRFHPLEILFSLMIKMGAIVVLGAPPTAVIIFEVLLNATAQFNHANLKLPTQVDALLRKFIVTPDMHRVHHSIIGRETNSNYGFNVPWWDYLFNTYIAQPEKGHDNMTIGLNKFRDPHELRLDKLFTQPFRN